MPPKGGVLAAREWSWAKEISSLKDITPLHRRCAAGLSGKLTPRPCAYKFDNLRRAQTVDSESGSVESSSSFVKDKNCQPKRCRTNPRCYNHIGGKEWEAEERDNFVHEHIGEEVTVREGPAGLKNYGATCYANAFLQVWFNNVAFRNGVYQSVGEVRNPLFHLASIFGMLQHSDRPVVDPGVLIDALQLNKGYQQDAAEFSKLFMDLLDKEFARAGAATFVKDQFQGSLEYRTKCNTCGFTSSSESPFLELEVSLKDKTSLESRIEYMLLPESLDGANKYACRECKTNQPATRSTHLKSLPPVLHFSLMRFVYDVYSGDRKKIKAGITYPNVLVLNGDEYHLRGVVSHMGTSARHGHFVCEVFNEEDQEWYLCSDAQVSKVGDRPKKRVKLDEDAQKETSSRDAYMLVYKKVTPEPVVPLPAPKIIMDNINADNVALHTEITERVATEQTLREEFDSLAAVKRDVLESLPGHDCIVPAEALITWIKSRDPNTEWDYSPLSCQHGNISPDAGPSVKLISRQAFDKLAKYCTIPELDICKECVEDGYKDHNDSATHEERVTEFSKLNEDGNGYVLPRRWLKDWKAGNLSPDVLPTNPEYSIFCEHGKPSPKSKEHQDVSASGLVLLRSIFGDFDAFETDAKECETCTDDAEAEAQENLTWSATVKQEKALRKLINPPTFSMVYLLPRKFAAQWKEYLTRPGSRPELDLELCPHGKLDFDPQMEGADYLPEAAWRTLCRLYGQNPSEAITVKLTPLPPSKKKQCVEDVSMETCEECVRERLSAWDEIWVDIVKGRDHSPESNGTNSSNSTSKRSTRRGTSRSTQWQLLVQKDTTVRWIRNQLYEMTKLSPIRQNLYYNGRELVPEDTMESIGFLKDDYLCLEEAVEVVDLVDDDDNEEGFLGSVLVGRISCPACTYSNQPGSEKCDMCETAFAI